MSWIKLDDQWMDHPKIIRAGRDARDMWLASITWCAKHLTDGVFPENLLPALAISAGVDIANVKQIARVLLGVCLWDACENGYKVHDYLDYNPTKEQALANKEARKIAGSAGGRASAVAKRQANAKQNSSKIQANGQAKFKQKSTPSPSPSPSPSFDPFPKEEEAVSTENPPLAPASPPPFQPADPADRVWQKIKPSSYNIPPTLRESVIPIIDAVLHRHKMDEDKAAEEGKTYFDAWCKRRGKNGKYYSPNGTGWIDWWAQGEIPSNGAGSEHKYGEEFK